MFRRGADITSAKSCREKLCSGWLVGIQRGPLRDPSPLGTMRREAWPPLVSRVAHQHTRAPLETLREIARTSASNICQPRCISRTLIESALEPFETHRASNAFQEIEIRGKDPPRGCSPMLFNLTESFLIGGAQRINEMLLDTWK